MQDSNRKVNPFLSALGNVLRTISFVIGTFILATILEWCGMHSWWKNASETHLSERTQLEIQQIESSVGTSFDGHWFRRASAYFSTLSDRLLAPIEQHLEAQQQQLIATPRSTSAVVNATSQVRQSINRHLMVAIEVFRAWLFRLLTFMFGVVSMSPLLLVGFVDGLVRREIRRWGGGRECAWIYTVASKSLFPTLGLFLAIYALWPWSFSFVWINSLMGICWGGALTLAIAKFKKYL
ncbi:MAG: DUF4400 domain-containing protein [Gammaproteobacteria bacterium]|nr:DUF4400 domain-containing protein [Gammaproteobacteria bacterium]